MSKQNTVVDTYITLSDVKPVVMDRNSTNATNTNPSNPTNQPNSSTGGNAFNDIDWWYWCCIFEGTEGNECDLCYDSDCSD